MQIETEERRERERERGKQRKQRKDTTKVKDQARINTSKGIKTTRTCRQNKVLGPLDWDAAAWWNTLRCKAGHTKHATHLETSP